MPAFQPSTLRVFLFFYCFGTICPVDAEEIIATKVIALGDTVEVLREGEIEEVPLTSMPTLINWVGSNLAVRAGGTGIWDGSSYTAFIPSSLGVPEGYDPGVAQNSDGNPPEDPKVSGFASRKYLNGGLMGVTATVDDAATEGKDALYPFFGVASTQGFEAYFGVGFESLSLTLWANDGSALLSQSVESEIPTSWIFPGGTKMDFPIFGDSAEELRPGSTHAKFTLGVIEKLFDDRSMFVFSGLTLAEGGAKSALFRISPDNQYEVLLVSGDPAPEIEGLAPSFFSLGGGPDMNESREVAFRAVLRDANQIGLSSGIFRMSPDADENKHYLPVPLALTGVDYQIGTSSTVSFSRFANADVHISESGDVYFDAVEEGINGSAGGTWRALAETGVLERAGPGPGDPIPGFSFSRVTGTSLTAMGKSGRLLLAIGGWYSDEVDGPEKEVSGYFFENEFGVFSPAVLFGMPIKPGGGIVTNVGENQPILEQHTQISDTNSLAMVLRVDNLPAVYVFRNSSEVEPIGNKYVWDGGAGDDNWHTVVNGRSNWTDSTGVPWPSPPPPDAELTIAGDVTVRLTQRSVAVRSISLDGSSLEVDLPESDNLTFESFLRVPEGSSLILREGEINSLAGFLEFEKPDARGPGGTFTKSGSKKAAISVAILKLLSASFTVEGGALSIKNGETWINGTTIMQGNGMVVFKDEVTRFQGSSGMLEVQAGSLDLESNEIRFEANSTVEAVADSVNVSVGSAAVGTLITFVGGTIDNKRSLQLKGQGEIEILTPFIITENEQLNIANNARQAGGGVVVNLPENTFISAAGEIKNEGRMILRRGGISDNFINEGTLVIEAAEPEHILFLTCRNKSSGRIIQNTGLKYKNALINDTGSVYEIHGALLEPEMPESSILFFDDQSQIEATDGISEIHFSNSEFSGVQARVDVSGNSSLLLKGANITGDGKLSASSAESKLIIQDASFERLFISGKGTSVFKGKLEALLPGGTGPLPLIHFREEELDSVWTRDPVFLISTPKLSIEDGDWIGASESTTVFNLGNFEGGPWWNSLSLKEVTINGLKLTGKSVLLNPFSSSTSLKSDLHLLSPFYNCGVLSLEGNIRSVQVEAPTEDDSPKFVLGFLEFGGSLQVPEVVTEALNIEPLFSVTHLFEQRLDRSILRVANSVHLAPSTRLSVKGSADFFVDDGINLESGKWTISNKASLLFGFLDQEFETLDPIVSIGRFAELNLSAPLEGQPSINGFPNREVDLEVNGKLTLSDTFLEMNGAQLINKHLVKLTRSEIRGNLDIPSVLPDINQEFVPIGNLNMDQGQITGTFTNGGISSLGSSPGVGIVDGDYIMEPTGEMHIEFAGTEAKTQYDQLEVTGTANLDGKLVLYFLDGYEPTVGEQFEFLKAPTITGNFVEIDQSRLGRNVRFDFAVGTTGMMATAMPLTIASYADWRAAFFTELDFADVEVSDPDKDPDGDGMTNRMEYAFGDNPNVPEGSPVTYELTETANPDEYMVTATFDWANDVTDSIWFFEVSDDLGNWSEVGAAETGNVNNGGFSQITAALTDPIDGTQRTFLRIGVKEAL